MTLSAFIDTYDHPGKVVLLMGKRDVLPADKPLVIALGRLLAQRTQHVRFRSGNAGGADTDFFSGARETETCIPRLEVITPFDGHRARYNKGIQTTSLDDLNLLEEERVVYQSALNAKTKHLIKPFVNGAGGKINLKAGYIIRDTVSVIGAGNGQIPPADFGIFYTDLKNPDEGGTGFTMKLCRINNVPLITQRIWFEWLNQ